MVEIDSFFCGAFVVGVAMCIIFSVFTTTLNENILKDETLQDICHNLFPNQTVVVSSAEDGKLICEVPSYDSTTNIIMREAK